MSQVKSNDKFDKMIKDWENLNNGLNDAVKNTEDVKNGTSTEEEEKKEPAYILLHSIMEGTSQMLQMPQVVAVFEQLSGKLGQDETLSLIQLLSILMTYSAHNAITLYDELLKNELQGQFDHISEHINYTKADVAAHTAVLEVHKKQLNELEKKLKLDSFKKDNGLKE